MKLIARTNGFTLIELMFVVTVIGILSAVAAPALSRTKLAANEASAISSLRVIHSGQMAFSVSCGYGFYATNLQDLASPVAGAPGYISIDLGGPAPVSKSGYDLELGSSDDLPVDGMTSCNGKLLVSSYHTNADPQPGRGSRYFGSNTGGGIFQSSEFAAMPDTGAPTTPWEPLHQ